MRMKWPYNAFFTDIKGIMAERLWREPNDIIFQVTFGILQRKGPAPYNALFDT